MTTIAEKKLEAVAVDWFGQLRCQIDAEIDRRVRQRMVETEDRELQEIRSVRNALQMAQDHAIDLKAKLQGVVDFMKAKVPAKDLPSIREIEKVLDEAETFEGYLGPAVDAGVALYSQCRRRVDAVTAYLRRRGWKLTNQGWIDPTNNGALVFNAAVDVQTGRDLAPFIKPATR